MEDNKLQEITFQSSTIETIDLAFYNWLNYEMDLSATYPEGWKKVPVTWVSAERTHQIKNDKEIRDSSGMIIYPIITIERKSINKDPQKTGSIPANLRAVNDEKGGVITIARRVNQEKTSNFQNADNIKYNRSPRSNPVFPLNSTGYSRNNKVVYETITIPIPVHVAVSYQVNIKTDYQQQLNELTTPFFTRNGNTRYIQLLQDGHKYDAFIKGDFNFENNSAQLNEERKTYSSSITIEVIGYLIGDDKNQIGPKMTVRESAVEFKFPRERVIVGDIQEFLNTSKNKTKYRS
jgi:hypothetical protein